MTGKKGKQTELERWYGRCISALYEVYGLCSDGADRCHAEADLKGLHPGLDDGDKDRFALMGVCKHVGDLVQEAGDKTETHDPGCSPDCSLRTHRHSLDPTSVNLSRICLIRPRLTC